MLVTTKITGNLSNSAGYMSSVQTFCSRCIIGYIQTFSQKK